MSVLVTGGAGYIGSHAAHALASLGEAVVVLDNLSTGDAACVPSSAAFVQGDVADGTLVARLMKEYAVDAVMHFAGSIIVPESFDQPLQYYTNNVTSTCALVRACVENSVRNFIFSSTAAVYGVPSQNPVSENAETCPISPYGRSKLMAEWLLEDCARAHGLRYVSLRYFNVAGADPKIAVRRSTNESSNLIKRAAQVALGKLEQLELDGTDYPTRDGSAIRDFIHVRDLVDAHLLALDNLRRGACSSVYNCGYGVGASVLEVVSAFERITGTTLPVRKADRRPGDAGEVIADSRKLRSSYGWTPHFDDLEAIVESALQWERMLQGLASR